MKAVLSILFSVAVASASTAAVVASASDVPESSSVVAVAEAVADSLPVAAKSLPVGFETYYFSELQHHRELSLLEQQHQPPEDGSNGNIIHDDDSNDDGDDDNNSRRSLAVYALYNLNPFAVTFTTLATEELLDAYRSATTTTTTSSSSSVLSSTSTTATLVSSTGSEDSSLSYPLREVTQQYIQQGFQSFIEEWRRRLASGVTAASGGGGAGDADSADATTNSTTTPTTSSTVSSLVEKRYNFNDMYNRLVTIDLRVKMYVDDNEGPLLPASNTGRRRRQQQQQQQQQQQLRQNAERSLQQTATTTADSGVIVTERRKAQIITEIYPTIAFTEPTDLTTKPSNGEIQQVFGDVMLTDLLTNDDENLDSYLRNLLQSSQGLLQGITDLDVQLNIMTSTTGSSSSSSSKRSSSTGWSDAVQTTVLTLLVVLSVAAFGVVVLFVRQRHIHKRRQKRILMSANLGLDLDQQRSRDEYHDEFYYDDPNDPNRIYGGGARRRGGGGHDNDDGGDGSMADNSFVSAMSSLSGTLTDKFGRIMRIGRDGQQQQRAPPGTFANAISPSSSFASSQPQLTRPPSIDSLGRAQSLDAHRHGSDVFPARRTSYHETNANSVLEASDRYLSRHRPDLYYDGTGGGTVGGDSNTVSVFGRTYEIPSNPFDMIYRGFQSQDVLRHNQQNPTTPLGSSPGGAFFTPTTSGTAGGGLGERTSSSGNLRRSSLQRSSSLPDGPSPRRNSGFTPITQLQNISAIAAQEDELDDQDLRYADPSPQSAHTGDERLFHRSDHSNQGTIGSSIWRNLSMSSWYGGGSNRGDVTPASAAGEEFVDYGDHDPSLFNSEIELEDLPPGFGMMLAEEEDPEDYNFAFQDFPRRDGTPCLIYNEDAMLQEREARRRKIFVVDDDQDSADADGNVEEKKSMDEKDLNTPVSDEAFMNMLSQNSQAIDGEELSISVVDASDSDSVDRVFGKSKQFQDQLAQLMETKSRRYAMEHKKDDIMSKHRKNRKQAREVERRNRHKEMEREIEDIEAEFFSPGEGVGHTTKLTMSPMRNDSRGGAHSPVPPSRHGMRAGSPALVTSPFRNNAQSVRQHHRRTSSNASMKANSPVPPSRHHRRSSSTASFGRGGPSPTHLPRLRDGTSSLGRGGQTFKPKTVFGLFPEGNTVVSSSSMGAGSDNGFPVDSANVRPVALFGEPNDNMMSVLSMPAMGPGDEKGEKAKYPSPQSVIDEIMNGGTAPSGGGRRSHQRTNSHHTIHRPSAGSYHQQQQNHRTTGRFPTRGSFDHSERSSSQHRRVNSFDVRGSFHRASSQSSYGGVATIDGGRSQGQGRHQQQYGKNSSRTSAASPVFGGQQGGQERTGRQRSSSVSSSYSDRGSSSHRRRRSSSRSRDPSDDVFLHGVVAKTRFI
eukprot:CAMPEP_0113522832 /NCGR_PEP_ID=MMETSP0014_2-20120614/45396_1 /TAXON_ID=2857 /ORGANISM="Nitzschia sp." /LENGTH=1395 /DNA_ID=CAMNT_0000420909 /DNA_START=327 /DNA_END=4514 /DNA_ORIENTATION=+ /assembly_acc=CAM_ASM_000159